MNKENLKKKLLNPAVGNSVLVFIFILIIVLLITTIIIVSSGYNLFKALSGLVYYSFGDLSFLFNGINRAMGLIMAGLAVSVAFRAGFFNIGVEGQILLGAVASAIVGFKFSGIPAPLHLILAISAGALFGAIGVLIPAILKLRLKVDEIITCIMLNEIYLLFTNYLVTDPFRDPERWSGTTPQISKAAELPYIYEKLSLSSGIFISLFIAVFLYFLMSKADVGYKWKISGLNPHFARYVGINVTRIRLSAAISSGVLAGITGALLVCGVQHRFWVEIGSGIGWDGVLIAMLAMNNPVGVIIGGFIFAMLKTGSLGMEISSHVPAEVINIALSFLILIVTGRSFIQKWIEGIKAKIR